MIGQRELSSRIEHQVYNQKFPRFSILIGDTGSGKKTLAAEIGKLLGIPITTVGVGVDNIRFCIEYSYKCTDPIIYLIADADNMSSAAANALLKVTEEPPNNAYFILTCETVDNLLPTIKSRGVTYMMEPYSYEDKCDYLDAQFTQFKTAEKEFILNVSSNIGDIERLLMMNLPEYMDFINLVVDNIAEVEGSNAFKISDKIALKDDPDKYDLRLFFKAFNSACVDRMLAGAEDALRYGRAVAITGDYLQQTVIRGINKQMLFDNWILDIRNEWA